MLASARLGLGVREWFGRVGDLQSALVRSKLGRGWRHHGRVAGEEKQRRGGERWEMTGGGHPSAVRGGCAGRGHAARLVVGPCKSGARAWV